MQSRRPPGAPGEHVTLGTARAQDYPLNDWQLVGLLGGVYLGGLGGFVAVVLAINQVF